MPLPRNSVLTYEEHTRILLWMSTLDEVKSLLRLAERALVAQTSEEVSAKDWKHLNSYHSFARSQPDYTPEVQKSSHLEAHNELHPREFADSVDCFAIANACRELAIVFFCQIFKSGYAENGNVASNNAKFIRDHFDQVVMLAFPKDDDRNDFFTLRAQLESARDSMLAHADASAFELTEFEFGVRHKLHSEALKGINFSTFFIAVANLATTTHAYALGSA